MQHAQKKKAQDASHVRKNACLMKRTSAHSRPYHLLHTTYNSPGSMSGLLLPILFTGAFLLTHPTGELYAYSPRDRVTSQNAPSLPATTPKALLTPSFPCGWLHPLLSLKHAGPFLRTMLHSSKNNQTEKRSIMKTCTCGTCCRSRGQTSASCNRCTYQLGSPSNLPRRQDSQKENAFGVFSATPIPNPNYAPLITGNHPPPHATEIHRSLR